MKDEDILKVFERALRLALTPIKIKDPRTIASELTITMEQMKLLPILFEWLLNQEVKKSGET
ncbi:MAG: hypothetical protein QW372_01760 [Nitrososphaerales archaeon]